MINRKKRLFTSKIIVDNIITEIDHTVEDYTEALEKLFPKEITDIRILKRGGLLLQPTTAEAFNSILKNKNKLTRLIFRPMPYIHPQENKDL